VRQVIDSEQSTSVSVPFSSEFSAFVCPPFIKHFICHERLNSEPGQALMLWDHNFLTGAMDTFQTMA